MSDFSTPLMRQYSAIKERHPNALLLFRLGDFYELFFEDAVVASKELQITLTSRNKEKGVAIPMCGVPYHAAESYIAKLIRRGYRVAICDQMEDPRLAKKLVKREVTRVVTPGTAIDSQILEPRDNNYLAAVAERDGNAGVAFVDLSTGNFRATEFSGSEASARLQEELDRMRPSELLVASRPTSPADSRSNPLAPITQTPLDDWVFAEEYGARLLRDHFRVATLAGYGLEGHALAVASRRSSSSLRAGDAARVAFAPGRNPLLPATGLSHPRSRHAAQPGACSSPPSGNHAPPLYWEYWTSA